MNYNDAYKLASKFVSKYIKNSSVHLVGSMRRKEQLNSDIDLLIVDDPDHTKSIEILQLLDADKNIKIINAGTKRISVIYKSMQIDIFFTLKEDLIPALFHWTGSKIFNIRTRKLAKAMGYKLNQYGLFNKSGEKIKLKNERSLFKILGIDYKKPEDRIH